jgi:hypothetical protein
MRLKRIFEKFCRKLAFLPHSVLRHCGSLLRGVPALGDVPLPHAKRNGGMNGAGIPSLGALTNFSFLGLKKFFQKNFLKKSLKPNVSPATSVVSLPRGNVPRGNILPHFLATRQPLWQATLYNPPPCLQVPVTTQAADAA